MAQPNSEFFPAIGQLADKTDLLQEREYQLPSQDDQDEDRPVEEIESLCMTCHEQVCIACTKQALVLTVVSRELLGCC